mmetsp:Transcript_15142/g.37949  ORF Transcript_15142/g.37949 Transcript_15142/m.37949 type:complete len:206 (+) Transcript_15142:800-1417(+)
MHLQDPKRHVAPPKHGVGVQSVGYLHLHASLHNLLRPRTPVNQPERRPQQLCSVGVFGHNLKHGREEVKVWGEEDLKQVLVLEIVVEVLRGEVFLLAGRNRVDGRGGVAGHDGYAFHKCLLPRPVRLHARTHCDIGDAQGYNPPRWDLIKRHCALAADDGAPTDLGHANGLTHRTLLAEESGARAALAFPPPAQVALLHTALNRR